MCGGSMSGLGRSFLLVLLLGAVSPAFSQCARGAEMIVGGVNGVSCASRTAKIQRPSVVAHNSAPSAEKGRSGYNGAPSDERALILKRELALLNARLEEVSPRIADTEGAAAQKDQERRRLLADISAVQAELRREPATP